MIRSLSHLKTRSKTGFLLLLNVYLFCRLNKDRDQALIWISTIQEFLPLVFFKFLGLNFSLRSQTLPCGKIIINACLFSPSPTYSIRSWRVNTPWGSFNCSWSLLILRVRIFRLNFPFQIFFSDILSGIKNYI